MTLSDKIMKIDGIPYESECLDVIPLRHIKEAIKELKEAYFKGRDERLNTINIRVLNVLIDKIFGKELCEEAKG